MADIWMWSFPENISLTSTTKMTPSRWKASMLICAIISRHWPGGAGVSRENWRISRRSSRSLFMLIIVLDARRTVIVPAILGPLFPFPSLTSFNSPFGHSRRGLALLAEIWYGFHSAASNGRRLALFQGGNFLPPDLTKGGLTYGDIQ